MRLRLVTAQAGLVTVDEAKQHLRVVGDHDDTLIQALIDAASAHIQRTIGSAVGSQTWEFVAEKFPAGDIEFDFGPVLSITSITYLDVGSAETVMPAEDYTLTARMPGVVAPVDAWPETDGSVDAVVIRFVAGDEAGVPVELKQATLLLVGHWYENRETVAEKTFSDVPYAVTTLIGLHRRMFV